MQPSMITATDIFCGAGGTTTGATEAGVEVRLAVNHWDRAIETHNTNYPKVKHIQTDISQADPRQYPPTTLLLASPECTSHSLGKGKKRKGLGQPELWEEPKGPDPAEERSRCTMFDPLRFAEVHDYPIIILENVVDVRFWSMWDAWLHAWDCLGYEWETVYFNSMFVHPIPQSRDRLYFVAWKKGNRKPNLKITPLAYCHKCGKDCPAVQSWKNPAKPWGKYGARKQYNYCCPQCASIITPYYYAAANAINWSLPIERIGDRKKPLKEKTMKRIAYGLKKFSQEQKVVHRQGTIPPFIIELNHEDPRVNSVLQPMRTQTVFDDTGITIPFIAELHGTSKVRAMNEALSTLCAGGQHHGLVMPPPFLMDHLGEYRPRPITRACSTICAGGNHQSLVVPPSWLMTYSNHGQMVEVERAAPTVTTVERHSLITIEQQEKREIKIEDCGFRMLDTKEIQKAMAFPDDYIVTGTRRDQVKQLGNAVTPPVMKLLVERCIKSLS